MLDTVPGNENRIDQKTPCLYPHEAYILLGGKRKRIIYTYNVNGKWVEEN